MRLLRRRDDPLPVPGGPSFLLPGGPTGCVLVHGFTSMPEEMRFLAEDLAARGHTVLAVRLAGHGTHPADLRRVRWSDWVASVADGYEVLSGLTDRVVVIGQSLGGMVALVAAARLPVAGVAALATPASPPGGRPPPRWMLRFRRMDRKEVVLDPDLGIRREADYPAYGAFPPVVLREVFRLGRAMQASLESVRVPALIVHATGDEFPGPEHGETLAAQIGGSDTRVVVLDGLGHGMVRDDRRGEAFDVIGSFVGDLAS
jgi:carboxylesterase